jgi:hypothetical protein
MMTRAQALDFLALFSTTPVREVDGQRVDSLDPWAMYLRSHFREDWARVIADVSRREGLKMTPTASAHLAAFEHNPPPARPSDFTARALSFIADMERDWHGDLNLLGTFAEVLAHGPIEVGELAVRTVRVFATGPSLRGWSARLASPGDRLLMVLGADDPTLFRHELAHTWCDFSLSEPPLPDLSAIALARARIACEARRLPDDLDLLEHVDESERRAKLLALAWGLPFSSDDEDRDPDETRA